MRIEQHLISRLKHSSTASTYGRHQEQGSTGGKVEHFGRTPGLHHNGKRTSKRLLNGSQPVFNLGRGKKRKGREIIELNESFSHEVSFLFLSLFLWP